MNIDEIISGLNGALQIEYSDVFLYPREAKMVKDKKIASAFKKFGLMEVRHADLLAMRILTLGGKPGWDFNLLKHLTKLDDILERHLDYEERAITLYGKLIPEVDDETKIVLMRIRGEEKEHLEKIKYFLNNK